MLPALFLKTSTDALFELDGTPKLPFDELVRVFELMVDPGLRMRRLDHVSLHDVCRDLQNFARVRLNTTNPEVWKAMTTALRLPVKRGEADRQAVNRWCRRGSVVEIEIDTVWLQAFRNAKTVSERRFAREAWLWCARVYNRPTSAWSVVREDDVGMFMDFVRLYAVSNTELLQMCDELYARIGFSEWDMPEIAQDEDDDGARRVAWVARWGWWKNFRQIFLFATESAAYEEDGHGCLDALVEEFGSALVVDTVILELRHSAFSRHDAARRGQLQRMLTALVAAVPAEQRVAVANRTIVRLDREGARFGNAGVPPKAFLASCIVGIVNAVGRRLVDPTGNKAWANVTLEELFEWYETGDDDDLPWAAVPFHPEVDPYLEFGDEQDASEDDEEEDDDDGDDA